MLTMNAASQQLFECFELALVDLIRAYTGERVEATELTECPEGCDTTAIVGLSSVEVSASVAIITSEDSVRALAEDPELLTADWLGELCNQLGGRLKNKMQCFGVNPSLSTPTTVKGRYLQVTSTAAESFELTVDFESGSAVAQLTLDIDPELELNEIYEGCTLEEGSHEFF